VVLVFPLELQKKLLHFATGSDRVPVGGLVYLNFKIAKTCPLTGTIVISSLIASYSFISNNII
jgi:E3 ubiquitin-protein ligase HECTD2